MKKLAVLTGIGAAAVVVRKLRRRQRVPDFTDIDTKRPQEKVEEIEDVADVPGGVRP